MVCGWYASTQGRGLLSCGLRVRRLWLTRLDCESLGMGAELSEGQGLLMALHESWPLLGLQCPHSCYKGPDDPATGLLCHLGWPNSDIPVSGLYPTHTHVHTCTLWPFQCQLAEVGKVRWALGCPALG